MPLIHNHTPCNCLLYITNTLGGIDMYTNSIHRKGYHSNHHRFRFQRLFHRHILLSNNTFGDTSHHYCMKHTSLLHKRSRQGDMSCGSCDSHRTLYYCHHHKFRSLAWLFHHRKTESSGQNRWPPNLTCIANKFEHSMLDNFNHKSSYIQSSHQMVYHFHRRILHVL